MHKRRKPPCHICIRQRGEELASRTHGRWGNGNWPRRYYHLPLGNKCFYGPKMLDRVELRNNWRWEALKAD